MEEFSFVMPVTGLSRPNTGKEDDGDGLSLYYFLKVNEVRIVCCGSKFVLFLCSEIK
jgi:hypothetical protein